MQKKELVHNKSKDILISQKYKPGNSAEVAIAF
jgi:hypothetical protein